MSSWVIIKFGGTSVSSRERWSSIAQIVQNHLQQKHRVVVVCSAAAKISRLLNKLIKTSLEDDSRPVLDEIALIYKELSADLDVSFDMVSEEFTKLKKLSEGISLLKEISPRTRAEMLAFGELIVTRLGQAFLSANGLNAAYFDIRNALTSVNDAREHTKKHYLAAHCDSHPDSDFSQQFKDLEADVVITQGFIARDVQGDTVLLGWGGSDISAAYIAAKLQAVACEIWTDVPGVYTANPHQIPQARLLNQLDYDEAQEIAAMGAKVLHPNTIPPMRQAGIPLSIKYTANPLHKGTLITRDCESQGLRIKSILTKYHITVITIETMLMWRHSGFLADIFACFKQHDISIDLVTTSESSVTVTLDNEGQWVDDARIKDLLDDLNEFSQARVIAPCAQVTLVGRNIRSILHQLGPVFEVFEAQQIHMLSQSSNDLNLSFIVNENQAERIAIKLHVLLVEHNPESYYYSKSWQEEFTKMVLPRALWWETKREELLAFADKHSPCYVYDNPTLLQAAEQLKACQSIDQIFYAMKANSNERVLATFYEQGIGFECVSLNEVELILKLFPAIDRKRILFTPNFAPKIEYQQAFDYGTYVTVDAVYPIAHWPEIFKDQAVLLRIDPGIGLGHHKYVSTGGNESKFGIPQARLPDLVELVAQHDIKVIGLHAHYGSGILQANLWESTATLLTQLLSYFPDVEILDLGGGLGIVERPGQQPLDTIKLDSTLQPFKQKFPQLQFWLEPGRFLVARAGVIIAKVTQLKQKGDTQFIGIETGMNSLIRPALYGSYHEIVNLSQLDAPPAVIAHIVGPICESGDTLGFSRFMPETKEGDIVLIANTGAYGFCMGSSYNLRQPALEYISE